MTYLVEKQGYLVSTSSRGQSALSVNDLHVQVLDKTRTITQGQLTLPSDDQLDNITL